MTVEYAKFRLAKPEEVIEAKGNCLWQGLQLPWNLLNTIFGTANMYFNRTNVLDWETPLPLKFTRAITWSLGIAPPHEAFIYPLRSIKYYSYQVTEAKVIAAFFKIHRNSELFAPSTTFMKLFHLAEEIFPETEFVLDDHVLTCTKEMTELYHQMFSGPMHGEGMKAVIEEEVKEALKTWTYNCSNGDYINITEETRLLASKIISRVLLGQKTDNLKLCNSVNFINTYMIKTFTGGITEKDKTLYQAALSDFRNAASAILERGDDVPLFAGKVITKAQKLALLISTYFAGQETVASLLNSIIYELGSNDKKMEFLEKDTVMNLFARSIHDFTPAYGTTRKCKTDICLKYRLEGEDFKRKVIFFKDDMISARILSLAENTELPEEGDLPPYSKWFPFGAGPHTCPGKNLAVNEVETMFVEFKKGYRIKLDPTMGEVKKQGLMTLQYSEDVYACIEKIEG